jgi:hypothetical protein
MENVVNMVNVVNVVNDLRYEELKVYSKNKILSVLKAIEFEAKRSSNKAIMIQNKIISKNEVQDCEFDLVTPSLVAAFESGVLDKTNYNAIKNGGLVYLEKYTKTRDGIKNCYDKIKVPSGTEKIIIIDNEENFLNLVYSKRIKFQKEKVEFELENRAQKYSGISEQIAKQNTLQCLFQ